MIAYPFHIASEQNEPFPRNWQMQLIAAESPEEALEKLKQVLIVGKPGQTHAWLRVVTDSHLDGTVRHTISQKVPVSPVARDN